MTKQTAYTFAYNLLIQTIRDYGIGLATMMKVQDAIMTFESQVILSYKPKSLTENSIKLCCGEDVNLQCDCRR